MMKISRSVPVALVATCLLSGLLSPVLAQPALRGEGPGSLPGKIMDYNLQPGVQHREPQPSPDAPKKPDVEDDIPEPDAAADPSLQRKIMIQRIDVEGVTVFHPRDIERLVEPYEHREITLLDLRELAEKLTTMYREKGYISSRVYVPPQTIEDGIVKIQAAEGLVGDVSMEGGRWFSARAVTNRINLTEGEPFRLDRLKTSMIRINDNPDLQVKATLKAGEKEGTTDVELDVTDRFPVHVTPFYDNLGRRLIGEQRGGLNVAHNNVLGFGDRNLTSLNWSRRSFGVVNHYEMPLGKSGTKIGFDYGYSTLTLGGDFKELDVRGTAKVYSPFISHEFYTSDTLRISADLPFDFVNLKTTILGEDFNEDRLRVLRPSFTMESYDRWGNTFFRNEFGVGVNLFNATLGNTNRVSRQGAGSKFFRYTGFLTRTQKLPLGTYGVFRAITQLSPDRLVSNEQLQVGGAFTVRGYREGLLIGDSGLVLSGEWRVPFFVVPKSWKIPMTDYSLRENLQFVSFTDFGSSWTNRPAPGVGGSEYIMGIGMGIRARLTRFVVGRVDFAWPLLRPDRQPGVNPHNHPRLHFGLQSELF